MNTNTDAMQPSSNTNTDGTVTTTDAASTLANLVAMESAARASLAAVAADREATFARALAFMHTCHSSLYTTLDEIKHLQLEKDTSEERLIAAETEASTSGELLSRTEETRRFLVNRVRCAAWEKKSHFHLTALDHMLGNLQPALFDVASMLRGHLAICAMARSAMAAQATLQTHISLQLETKEFTFKRVKTLGEEMESAASKSEELKAILRDMKRQIGKDLERFIGRKQRMRRASAETVTSTNSHAQSTVASPDMLERTTSMYVPAISSPPLLAQTEPDQSAVGFGTLKLDSLSDLGSPVPSTPYATLSPFSPISSGSGSVSSPRPKNTSPIPLASPLSPEQSTPTKSPTSPMNSLLSPRTPPSPEKPSGMNISTSSPSPSSPPSPRSLSWPMPSAPPCGVSLLVSTLTEGEAWPSELEQMASEHVEHLIHPTHAGQSSHALSDPHDISPPITPPPVPKLGPFVAALSVSPGAHPTAAIVTSPPRGQVVPSSFLRPEPTASSHRSSSLSTESHVQARSPPTSPGSPSSSSATSSASTIAASSVASTATPAVSSNSGTSRQGYLSIKMRYFQTLGQVKSGSSPPGSPTSSARSSSAPAAVLARSASASGILGKRWGKDDTTVKSPPASPAAATAATESTSMSLTTSAATSGAPSSSSPPASPTLAPIPSAVTPTPQIRARPIFSTSPLGPDADNKRWLLRPLPPNAKEAQENATSVTFSPELTPLVDENIHSPVASTVAASTSTSGSPTVMSPSSPSSSPVLNATLSPPPSTGVSSSTGTSSSSPTKKSWWSSLFSRRGSDGQKSPAEIEKDAAKQREKDRKHAEKEAAKRAKEAEKIRLAQEKEAKQNAKRGLGSSSSAIVPLASPVVRSMMPNASPPTLAPSITRTLPEWHSLQQLYDDLSDHALAQQSAWETLENVLDKRERAQAEERRQRIETERKEKEEAERRARMPPPSIVAVSASDPTTSPPPKSPSPLVPSSHAISSSTSAMLYQSSGGSPGPSSGSTTPPLQSADRPARKSVLSLLQSVPAPTLMATDMTDTSGSSVIPDGGSAGSAIMIPNSLRPLAIALRAAVLEHLSRSLPNTPPPHAYSANGSFVPSGSPGHVRRASDSQAAGQSPRSAPPSVRSSSFSFSGGSGPSHTDLDLLRYEEQRRQWSAHHHHSPPSPSSLVF